MTLANAGEEEILGNPNTISSSNSELSVKSLKHDKEPEDKILLGVILNKNSSNGDLVQLQSYTTSTTSTTSLSSETNSCQNVCVLAEESGVESPVHLVQSVHIDSRDLEENVGKNVMTSKPVFTSKQWATLVVFSFVNIWAASCISIQAPFLPKKAEEKGVTNTESGFIFGCFQFTVLIMSPIFGKYMGKIGPKLVFNVGIAVTGVCCILFGFLTFVDNRIVFVSSAMIIRIIEAIGYSAGITATFTLIAATFPDSVATVFASLETFNGVGLIIGPMIGAWFYHLGGFLTPFVVIGCLLLVGALAAYYVMPETSTENLDIVKLSGKENYFTILRIPSVAMAGFSIFAAAVSIGFNFPTIEPHVRSLNLDGWVHWLTFVTHGLVYAVTAPIWGRLCDKSMNPNLVTMIGAIFIFVGIGLIGPTHPLPMAKSFGVILVGLCIQGLGLGAVLVAGFSQALRQALEFGYPMGIGTYGLVSGLWMGMFSLGNFFGSSTGGFLYDEFDGYPKSSIFVMSVQLAVVGVYTVSLIRFHGGKKQSISSSKDVEN